VFRKSIVNKERPYPFFSRSCISNSRFFIEPDAVAAATATAATAAAAATTTTTTTTTAGSQNRDRAIPNLFSASVTRYGQFVRDRSRGGREKKPPSRLADSRGFVMRLHTRVAFKTLV